MAAQRDVLAEVAESFPVVPVWRSSYQPGEPVGPDALAAFAAAAYGGDDPLAAAEGDGPMTITPHRRRGGAADRRCRSRRGRTSTWPGTATSWW